MSHLVAIDGLLDTTDQVFAKVDGDLLIGWQVDVGIDSQKVVALALAPVLRSERNGGNGYTCLLLPVAKVVLLAVHHDCSLIYDRNNSYPLL